MTTTPSEQVIQTFCVQTKTLMEPWEREVLTTLLDAALATARAEEREACIAMVRERVERFRLSEPEGAAFLSALEHALTRRAEEESGRG